MAAGTTASRGSVTASALVPAQTIDDIASAKVAMRDETWRRRKRLRLTCPRNQNWIIVADDTGDRDAEQRGEPQDRRGEREQHDQRDEHRRHRAGDGLRACARHTCARP